MVNTIKFSQFSDAVLGDSTNELVGLGSGVNVKSPKIVLWTTATRPSPPTNGLLGFNTDLKQYEFWDASTSAWIQLAEAGTIGTVTSISEGSGITLTPNPITSTGSVALTVPVSVANGGTGFTSYNVGDFIYATGTTTLSKLGIQNSSIFRTNASGVPSWSGPLTNGQLMIGSTGAAPVLANLNAGTGIAIVNGPGSITISNTGSATGRLLSFQVLTTGTGATYTKPSNVTSILIEMVGGGGGGGGASSSATGGSAGGGGGGGGYVRAYISPASSTYTYSVGTSGAGGAAGNNAGTSGGNTTFSTFTANGGAGGGGDINHVVVSGGGVGGAPGTPSGGNVNINGGNGTNGIVITSMSIGGQGGGTYFSQGSTNTISTSSASAGNSPGSTTNNGAGGSGGSVSATASNVAGGAGSKGLIIVWEFS